MLIATWVTVRQRRPDYKTCSPQRTMMKRSDGCVSAAVNGRQVNVITSLSGRSKGEEEKDKKTAVEVFVAGQRRNIIRRWSQQHFPKNFLTLLEIVGWCSRRFFEN
ncbi:hypothetical protein XENOCAPTIV_030314 [Xenoophorus captivus]|uniref:Uncharacterized protein n=1 Tax=Xenoophorus captivus TaxID=1517983 RepID=A0ABV0Q452_9TELE